MELNRHYAIADWAETVKRIVEGTYPAPVDQPIQWPYPLPELRDCGCPQYGICMNTACPRAVRITNSLNTVRPIESPHSRYDHS